ncbi:MAG TPA: hypothetical protein VMS76_06605 [Planctomycetota bacterium]|nr:hypothetical protein [Planctomycetota bacterium]
MRAGLAVLALFGALTGTAGAAQERVGRLALGRVELEGPLEELRVALPPAGEARLQGPLAPGERASLRVPLPAWEVAPALEPRIAAAGEGRARWLGWDEEDRERRAEAWRSLPAALRGRPLPAIAAPATRPPLSALLAAAALLALLLRLRSRAALVLGVGALGAGLVLALSLAHGEPAARLRLFDGDGASGRWIVVDAARPELELGPRLPLRLESEPPRTPLRFAAEGFGAVPTSWRVRGARGEAQPALFAIDAFDPAGRALQPGRNGWASFEATWVRDPQGSWSAHGPWPEGEPLPDAAPGGDAPPGWIQPALPLGVGLFIGRVAPRPDLALERDPPLEGGAWVRLVGF